MATLVEGIAPLPKRPAGHPGYLAELDHLRTLHSTKAADYGIRGGDPIANLRASADLGIEPWRATLVRAGDKWSRIKSFMVNGDLVNESFVDSLRDMAAYLLLAKVLYDEAERRRTGPLEQQAVGEVKAKRIDEFHGVLHGRSQ